MKLRSKIDSLSFFGLKSMLPFIYPHRRLIILLAATMAAVSGIEALLPLFQNYAITHFIGNNTLDTLHIFCLLYLLTLAVQAAITGIGAYASCVAEVSVDRDVRSACFKHIQTLGLSYFNSNSVGYIHSRCISDPDNVGRIISWGLMDAVCSIAYITAICAVMLSMNFKLGLMLLCIVPILIAITAAFSKPLKNQNSLVRELNGQITGRFNEGISGISSIKSLVIEDLMHKDFQTGTREMYKAASRAGRTKALFNSTIIFASSFALALVMWRGGLLTKEGLMLTGTLSVFMNYATTVTGYVQDLVGAVSSLITSQASIERIDELLNTQPDISDRPEVLEKYGDSFEPKTDNWEELNGDIEFQDVSFRYSGSDVDVLEHFNLKIPRGSMMAVVGETGAGKSTLAGLICRFYEPNAGRILIDGRDIKERSQLWLRRRIGCVLQTPHLFSGTVADNLRYGCPNASDEQLKEAMRLVNAEDIVLKMENGYDSPVGEGGCLLSTGEKQLISFARALLADPSILILDEATSSIDTLTEKTIQDAIKTVTAGRTSFIIAHRLSTIKDADIIIVIKDGQIVETGTHKTLINMGGYYSELWQRQYIELECGKLLRNDHIEEK